MARRQTVLSLKEIDELINADVFFSSDNEDDVSGPIDIVEIPPDRVDEVSDNEEIDEDIIDDEEPADVPGLVEIHCVTGSDQPVIVDLSAPSTCTTTRDLGPPPTKKKMKSLESNWKKKQPHYSKVYPNSDNVERRKSDLISELQGKSPVECFEKIFDNTIVSNIVQQTVTYATQKNNHQFQLSNECIRKFIGILLFTGYHSLPQEQLYWCEDDDMDVHCVRKCMSRNRYLEIKRYLHISDNSELESIAPQERDKLFKIRRIINQLNDKFLQFGVFSENLSIDEQMVRYYGHHYLKQFMRGKPIRFGFKQWAICCSQTGYCYQMQVYEGKRRDIVDDETIIGLGASVVMKMISILETPKAHKVYFDNFFTGFPLMKHLQDAGVRATGTVRFNRMNKCPIATDKEMKKKSRGSYDHRFDSENEILAVTWNDNNCVKLLSNYELMQPISQVKRWSRTEKKDILVSQPKLITEYNTHMGGVDKMDWNVQKYRIRIRGKKWYFPLLTNAIDVSVVNAHVLYCLTNGTIPLLDFRRIISRAYLALSSELSDPKKAGRKSFTKSSKKRVSEDIRTSGNHHLERTEEGKQRKCAVCKTNVRRQCHQCDVGLHVECFSTWHKK